MKKAYLVLANGRVFEGQSIGAVGNTLGEVVFTTGVVGYLETLTDPNYTGQIVVQTFPLIGNYGVIEEDLKGKCAVSGYVVRDICDAPSNFRCDYALSEYLKDQGVVGICGVDTRELTAVLRDEGVMNAMICTELPADMDAVNAYSINGAVRKAGSRLRSSIRPEGETKCRVALIDYGKSRDIALAFAQLGCAVDIYPCDTQADVIIAGAYDGAVLSDGPGAPDDERFFVNQAAALAGKLPLMGIGLGHQLIALAMGGRTDKLRYGHRGSNQPVRDLNNGRTYITNQNHGYTVNADSLVGVAVKIFENANDGACEGLEYSGLKIISLQFMPDISSGSRDAGYTIERFISMMGGADDAQR